MPTYEYRCKSCGETLEVVQSFTDEPLTTHEACGGDLRKVFGSVGIAFKGSGFYKNDSRGKRAAVAPPGGGDSSGDKGGSADKGGSSDKGASDKGASDKGGSDKGGSSDSSSSSTSSSGDTKTTTPAKPAPSSSTA